MPFGKPPPRQLRKLSPFDRRIYTISVEDPPWLFNDQLPGPTRGAGYNYDSALTNEQIIKQEGFSFFPPLMADDSIRFLWRVGAMVEEAYAAMRARDFEPKAEIVWCKKTKTGKRWIGMGRTVRWEHETCIIGVRGSAAKVITNNSTRSTFDAPVPVYGPDDPSIGKEINGRIIKVGDYIHSGKPDRFYEIVDAMCGTGLRVELFARPRTKKWRRPGWVCYGNELPGGKAE